MKLPQWKHKLLTNHMILHVILHLCNFRDLVLPDGNRVSAFSVASTAIAAAQWSSTQVRIIRVFFLKVAFLVMFNISSFAEMFLGIAF